MNDSPDDHTTSSNADDAKTGQPTDGSVAPGDSEGPPSDTPEKLYKTGEVLSESGISRQMLYRYMQMDLVIPAHTTETGRNLFSDSVFKQIKLIQQLNERYPLQHIREIFARRFSEKKK